MEVQAPEITPVQVTTPPQIAPVQVSPPAQQMEEGGAIGSITRGKMNIKDIVISALLFAVSVYAILYYRKGIKKLDESPSAEQFLNMTENIEEVEYNVKKLMGKRYQST